MSEQVAEARHGQPGWFWGNTCYDTIGMNSKLQECWFSFPPFLAAAELDELDPIDADLPS
jgi:hypothetical protein